MEKKIVRVIPGDQQSLEELKRLMKKEILQGVWLTALMTALIIGWSLNGKISFLLGLLCGMQLVFLLILGGLSARYRRFEKQYFCSSDLSSGDEKTTSGVFSQFAE